MDVLHKIESFSLGFYEKYSRLLWFFYWVALLWVSYRCFWFALDSSLDMQWYPTLHFWGLGAFQSAINPYFANLNGDAFMANAPNYMPLLYFLMYPFALLEWNNAKIAFAFLNFFLFLATLAILLVKAKHRAYVMLFSICAILGFTYSNVVANAQSTIFMGFCIVGAYFFRKNAFVLTLMLTLVLIKHSVGVPVLLGFFLAGYRKEVFFACMMMFVVILISSIKFSINPFELIQMMLQVNASTYTSIGSLGGPADLVSLSQKIFHKPYSIISCLIVLIYLGFILSVWKNKPSTSQIVSASIVLSLATLPHLGYDYYLLFIALVLMMEGRKLDFAILFTLGLSLFLWRCSFLKPWIDFVSNKIIYSDDATYWAMNMGIPFCIVVVFCFTFIIFVTLLTKELPSKKNDWGRI